MPYPSIRSSRPTTSSTVRAAVVLVMLVAAPSAHAGVYGVRACHADGINRSWTAYSSSGAATAYVQCPTGSNTEGGLYARNTGGPEDAPNFANAGMSFDAPPGTIIDELHFDGFAMGDGGWQAGVWDWSSRDWVWCGPACSNTWIRVPTHIGGLRRTTVTAMVVCAAASCPRNRIAGAISLANVTVRLQDLWDPSVAIVGGDLVGGQWVGGPRTVEVAGSDNTGIRTLQVGAQGALRDLMNFVCDDTQKIPCTDRRHSLLVATGELKDGRQDLGVQAVDASGNVTGITRDIFVDNHPPAAPRGLTADGDWKRENAFDVGWTNPSQAGVAPIAGVAYQFCDLGRNPERCTTAATTNGSNLQRMPALKVPGPGAWSLRLWLVDAAGNQNEQTWRETTLRFDPTPPEIELLASSPDDPARIAVRASDATSGIAATEIEIRRQGDTRWHSLATQPAEGGFAAFVDDEALPGGTYAIRARVRDAAGNERSTDGSGATISLPVRLGTTLRVGKVKRVKAKRAGRRSRRILITRPLARLGRKVTLSGRLRSPGGNPLAGRDLTVSQLVRLPGAAWQPVATVRTSARGGFRFTAPPGPSRLLRFRYAGTSTIQGRTRFVDLRVRAGATIRASRRSVVNGEEVMFRGRLRGEPIPPVGKLVQLQVFSRGQWLTFAAPRTGSRGRWRWRYRFTATRGVTRYRFRVRVPVETGYPYAPGASRSVNVKVRGL